jgi:hypothetical protein
MLDYLRKFYEKLTASILDPVVEWILALSWGKRVLVLLAISAAIGLWRYPEPARDALAFSTRAWRVFTAPPNLIPLSASLIHRESATRARLLAANSNDVNLIATGAFTGWSAAQTLIAITKPGKHSPDEDRLVEHIRATRLAGCNCWAELNNQDERYAWTFISGWAMSALAAKQEQATAGELAFLLDNQNPDGSWNSIPATDLSTYASVYATGWAVIGLLAQLNAGLVPNQQTATRAKFAASRGAAWLLKTRQHNARWKPYPNLTTSSISVSISGLAMHALHMALPEQMEEIDKAWLDNIPASAIPASLGENSYLGINRGNATVQIDHFVQLTMPWTTIATIDAYANGDLLQKTRALGWMERTLSHESVNNADAEQENWWRAELLIALNYLDKRIDKKHLQKR